jgi:myo-inositol-1(or 4)-monophosphatase
VIERVVEVVLEAGRIIHTVRAQGLRVSEKGREGPVTQADRQADCFLRARLLAIDPVGWLSEETADDPSRLEDDRVWIVDPLDGTMEFIQGLPEYTVSVALVENGEPILAVVHNPATGETYRARKGQGAYQSGKRLRVRDARDRKGRPRLLASRTEVARGEFHPFKDGWELVPLGSTAQKLALVAAGWGATTLSRGPKGEWDVCAGSLLVEEAGGIVTNILGEPLTFNRTLPKVRGVLAGTPAVHSRLLAKVRALGPLDRMTELNGVAP